MSSKMLKSYFIYTLSLLLVFPAVCAQNKEMKFPKESLKSRVQQIAKTSGRNIIFDGELLNKIEVPPLVIPNGDMEQALKRSLVSTGFTMKAMPDGSIVIRKEEAPGKRAGRISGRIVESETSDPLPGAMVTVSGTQLRAVSDENGYYSLPDIPAGEIVLKISYVGFNPEKLTVNLRDGETRQQDIKLSAGVALNEVEVKAVRRSRAFVPHTSEKLLVAEVKGLSAVVSGISSEQISRTADRNVADVVKKIAGVTIKDDKFVVVRGMNERYNIVYLNDNIAPSTELNSRAFALDLLPSRIIDKILVYKTASPELSADMTGGAVKIYTKDAVAVKHFDIQVSLSARPGTAFNHNYITYRGSGTDFLGFDNGLRALPSVVPGYGDFTKANVSQSEYVNNFSNILYYKRQKAWPDLQFTANYYDAFQLGNKVLSMLTSFSYKNDNKLQNESGLKSSFDGFGRPHSLEEATRSQNTAQLTLLQNFSLRLNNNHSLYFRNFLMQQGQSGTSVNTQTKNLYSAYTPEGSYWAPGNNVPSADRTIVLSYTQRTLYSGNLSGKHNFAGGVHTLNWNLGYIYSLQQIPDQRIIRLKYNDYYYINLMPGDASLHWTASVRPADYGSLDYKGGTSVERGIISRTWTRNAEAAYDGALDYSFKPQEWICLKAGTYHQWKERILFRRVYTVNEGDLDSNGFPYTNQGRVGSGSTMDYNRVFFKEQDLPKVWSNDYLRDDGIALKVYDRTSGSDAYTATQQNNSYYAALGLYPFNKKLEIYGGLRMEYNRQKVAGAMVQGQVNPVAGGINIPVLVDKQEADWLPSVNVNLRPLKSIVFRMAYGQTVNRTEFREISPYSELDYMNNQYTTGNTVLKNSRIKNYDLRFELYPGGNGANMISIGGFYKDITNPIERTIYRNLYWNFPAVISYKNAEKASVRGLELEWNQNLGFISLPFIKDLSFNANFSLIDSKVNMTKNGETMNDTIHYFRQLQGQSPYAANAGLYYENIRSGTKIGIIYNLIGPRIYAAATGKSFSDANKGGIGYIQSGDAGSTLELKREQLDLSIQQRIGKSLQLKFSVQNLLNGPIRFAEDENFTYKYEKAVWTPPAGYNSAVAGTTFYNTLSGDPITSEYKNDRYFNLTVTYSF